MKLGRIIAATLLEAQQITLGIKRTQAIKEILCAVLPTISEMKHGQTTKVTPLEAQPTISGTKRTQMIVATLQYAQKITLET